MFLLMSKEMLMILPFFKSVLFGPVLISWVFVYAVCVIGMVIERLPFQILSPVV